jgi:urea transport system permease protein
VWFAILSQALTYVAMLLMFGSDTGFGNNNGMTGSTSPLGMPMGAASTTAALAGFLICGRPVNSPFGHVLVAIRDDEARLRFLDYGPVWQKLAARILSGVLAAIAGALYILQVGIIDPRPLSPEISIVITVWVALGGRGNRRCGHQRAQVLADRLRPGPLALHPGASGALIVVVYLPNDLVDRRMKQLPDSTQRPAL